MTGSRMIRWIVVAGAVCGLLVAVVLGGHVRKGHVAREDGFVDIDLPIVDSGKAGDGVVSVTARGEVRGTVVGFAVDIEPRWKEKRTGNREIAFYRGRATIRSIGRESDAFVRVLAELYRHPGLRANMPRRIDAEAVGLLDDPRNVLSRPTRMKLFFGPESEKDYAEVFLNLDIPAGRLEFHEKDPEYRIPLLRALGAGI